MKTYLIVTSEFFIFSKKFFTSKAETFSDLEQIMEKVSQKNPTCVVAAYEGEELLLAYRPYEMMEEHKKILNGNYIDKMLFSAKWRVNPFTGEQEFPDYSLYENLDESSFISLPPPREFTKNAMKAPAAELAQVPAGA